MEGYQQIRKIIRNTPAGELQGVIIQYVYRRDKTGGEALFEAFESEAWAKHFYEQEDIVFALKRAVPTLNFSYLAQSIARYSSYDKDAVLPQTCVDFVDDNRGADFCDKRLAEVEGLLKHDVNHDVLVKMLLYAAQMHCPPTNWVHHDLRIWLICECYKREVVQTAIFFKIMKCAYRA